MKLLMTAALALSFAAPARAQLAPPNAAGVTFGHVHLTVRDVEVHKSSGPSTSAASSCRKDPSPRKRGTLETTADAPGMNLTFAAATPPPTLGTRGRTVDHIGFEVTNLEAFCRKLEARGIKFDTPFRNVPAVELNIAFTDPSGVYIELTEGYAKY